MALLSDCWKLDAFALLIGVTTVLYLVVRRQYSYWERRGFKTLPDVSYICGHLKGSLLQREFAGDSVARFYNSTNEPFIGMYSILRPILLVRDPELIRSILIKDFNFFTDRGVHSNESFDPLSGNLFALPGKKWRNLRAKLTPTFTSGKLKTMFSTLLSCGSTLQKHLDNMDNKNNILDVQNIASCYTINIIASVGFGFEVDSISDQKNDFRIYCLKIFEKTIKNSIRMFMFFSAPMLMSVFRVRVNDNDVENFIFSVVKQNLEYREKNNTSRKDFFQLLIQLRNSGSVQLDDEWETEIKADESQKSLTLNEMAAQTFIFFAAGYETSSTTLTFCMYELAKNQDVQARVHEEIDKVLNKNNGNITYDAVAEMKYLDACIDETMRKYPILPILTRSCVEDYTIPGTNKVIEKGTNIFIPALGLQMDEKYYKDPEKFDPDRFNEENAAGKNLLNRPYLPFGEGPRNCIGMRLGKMQTKVGLLMLLQKHRFELSDKLKNTNIRFDPQAFLISPLGGLDLPIFKR